MFNEMTFRRLYSQVRPTVLRLRRLYHIKLWAAEDWEQEGMLALFDLVSQCPELVDQEENLRVYFKTKFVNRVNDELRKQESLKRRFNKLSYQEIGTVAHAVPSQELLLDELVVFQDALEGAKTQLSSQEMAQLDDLMSGARFKGRRNLVRKLRQLLRD